MAWKGRSIETVNFQDLLSILSITKLQSSNPPLYQVLSQMIQRLTRNDEITVQQIQEVVGNISSIGDTIIVVQAFTTALQQLQFLLSEAVPTDPSSQVLVLPNARQLLPGVGVSFDDTVDNQRTLNATGVPPAGVSPTGNNIGSSFALDGAEGRDGLDGFSIVGPPGPVGPAGASGSGSSGSSMPLVIEAEEPEIPYIIPGHTGPIGATGATGATGPTGPSGTNNSTLLETQTASASASLVFSSRNAAGQSGASFQSDYDEYEIHFVGLLPANNSAELRFLVSIDGGATWAASNYYWSIAAANLSTGFSLSGNPSTTGFLMNDNTYNAEPTNGIIRIYNPLATGTQYKQFLWDCTFRSSTQFGRYSGAGLHYGNTSAITAIQIKITSGNITSGVARLYGIVK